MHSSSQQWPLSLAEKSAVLNVSCAVVQQLNPSFQSIMADTSKMNNAFRVATLQTWDGISSAASAAAVSNAPPTAVTSSHSTRKADSVDLFDDILINNTAGKATAPAAVVATVPQSNNLPVDEKNPFGDDADGDNPFGFAE